MLKFIKKIWDTGDAVLPDDLNRHEEGIYNNEKKIGDKSVAEQIKEHNTNGVSHQDIRNLIPVIANNLTTQNAKQALSALQGYLLNQQINVLLPLLGSSTALKTAEELNNLKTNGEYMFSPLADITIGGQTFTNGFVYNVKVEVNLWEGVSPVVTQTITCGYSHVGDKRMLWRTFYAVGDWSLFNNVATTDKTEILCTPKPGYRIASQLNHQINNIVYYCIEVERSDGGVFPLNQNDIISIPNGKAGGIRRSLACSGTDGVNWNGLANATLHGNINLITLNVASNNAKKFILSGEVVL